LTSSDRLTLGYRKQSYSQGKNLYLSDSSNTSPVNYPWDGNNSAFSNEIQYSKSFSSTSLGFIRYSQNFRIPNIDDNSSSGYWDSVANKTILLTPQASKDVDIGASFKSEIYAGEILYFHSKIQNEIGYDPSLGNINYDPTQRSGVNFKQRIVLSRNLATRLNLQYTHAEFTEGSFSGKSTPNVAPISGNLSLDYNLSDKDQITATTRFANGRYMSGDFANTQPKTSGYAVEDLSYFHKEKNWSLIASASNITNKKYTDTGIYHSTFTSPYKLTVYPNWGRNFSLTGRYTF
jgi:iron complex outermembrane receptor protein